MRFGSPALAWLLVACAAEPVPEEQPPSANRPAGCAIGELADGDACLPAGLLPEECVAGFVFDGEAGCRPILPDAPCEDGTMATLGDEACRPIGDCGSGTWGNIVRPSGTQHVDAAYAGTDSDGSEAKPWRTLREGWQAAPPGGTVAIAAGSYDGNFYVDAPVTFAGRCAQMVEIVGSPGLSSMVFRPGSSGSAVRDVSFRGGHAAIVASGADASIDRVWLHDTELAGIALVLDLGPASLTVTGSLIDRAADIGVYVDGGSLTLEDSVVLRTVRGALAQSLGMQVTGFAESPASLVMRRSVVAFHEGGCMDVIHADASIEASALRTCGSHADPRARGLNAYDDANVSLVDSTIEDSIQAGALALAATLDVRTTTIVGVRPGESGAAVALGVLDQGIGVPALETHAVAVVGAAMVGNAGAPWTASRLYVRDDGSPTEFGGGVIVSRGIQNFAPASLDLQGGVIRDALIGGIGVYASSATLSSLHVDNSRPRDGLWGDGVGVDTDSDVLLERVLVTGSARAGVLVWDGRVRLRDTTLQCNLFDLDVEGTGTSADDGGNICGCGDDPQPCKAVSSMLSAPQSPFEATP